MLNSKSLIQLFLFSGMAIGSFANAEMQESTLLEDLPAESTLALTAEIDIDVKQLANGQNFGLDFLDGKIRNAPVLKMGIPSVPSKSEMVIEDVGHREGWCGFMDLAKDYGDGPVIKIMPGHLFTIRSHRYGPTYYFANDPGRINETEQQMINLFNTPSPEANRLPSVSCENKSEMGARKPNVGDLKRITGGLFTVLPPTQ